MFLASSAPHQRAWAKGKSALTAITLIASPRRPASWLKRRVCRVQTLVSSEGTTLMIVGLPLNTSLLTSWPLLPISLADALLVCEDDKTLAALQRQFLDAPDASNMADFLRISPWQAADVRAALRANQVQWALAQAAQLGLPKVIAINLDDSLGEKAK